MRGVTHPFTGCCVYSVVEGNHVKTMPLQKRRSSDSRSMSRGGRGGAAAAPSAPAAACMEQEAALAALGQAIVGAGWVAGGIAVQFRDLLSFS